MERCCSPFPPPYRRQDSSSCGASTMRSTNHSTMSTTAEDDDIIHMLDNTTTSRCGHHHPNCSNNHQHGCRDSEQHHNCEHCCGKGDRHHMVCRREHNNNDGAAGDNDAVMMDFKMGDPIHNKTDSDTASSKCIGQFRNTCGYVVNHKYVQYGIAFLIFVNAIVLGALTFDSIQDDKNIERGLEYLDLSILIVFTIETSVQFLYLGLFRFWKHGWLVFDFIILAVSWAFMNSNYTVLRSLRVFRILLLIKKFESLRDLFLAVGKVLPKMFSIWIVFIVFFYVFSVLFTFLYQDLYEDGYLEWDYFGRLDWTFLTLFQFTTLDSWMGIVRQVMDAHPWAWLGFVAWVVITAFFLLNMIIAVICQSLHEMSEAREDRRHRKMFREQRHMFSKNRDEMMRETQTVLEMQRQMLQNQLEMQRTLNTLMVLMVENNKGNSGSGGGNVGKNGLKHLLESFGDDHHDDDDNNNDTEKKNDDDDDDDKKPAALSNSTPRAA